MTTSRARGKEEVRWREREVNREGRGHNVPSGDVVAGVGVRSSNSKKGPTFSARTKSNCFCGLDKVSVCGCLCVCMRTECDTHILREIADVVGGVLV